jgi:hypothetical protein
MIRSRFFSSRTERGDKARLQTAKQSPLIIFSEGKIYWSTFKPIVEALLERKFSFRYISMDIEDPGLTFESEYMDSRYIGVGSAAFARAASVRADVMLQTTPNIGTPGYPMPAPPRVRCLAHVLHGVGSIAFYYKYALDACDAILLMGDCDRGSVRRLEKKRGLKPRELVSAGVPAYDDSARKVKRKSGQSEPPVILIAPSWGEKNCLTYCGTDFIYFLLRAGYHVIIRPHPFSLKVEKNFINTLQYHFESYPNVRFDLDVDSANSLSEADLMISDKSGVRFDFAFLYERPVITLDVPLPNQNYFEISDLDYVWENDVENKLGPVVLPERMLSLDEAEFLKIVADTLRIQCNEIARLRELSIANIGCSGSFIADWAIDKCAVLALKK